MNQIATTEPAPVLLPPLPDGKFAHIVVKDNANSPAIQRGDILVANLSVDYWGWDGLYVVELHGQQLVRRVQALPRGLYVFCDTDRDNGTLIDKKDLRILAAIDSAMLIRRFA